MAGIGALALMFSVVGPRFSSNWLQRALLIVFALQTAWTAASLFWAPSLGNAWEEANRTLMYLLVLVLAFAAVRWAGSKAIKAIAAAVAASAGVVAVYILITLAISGDPLAYFGDARLKYPITYFNGLAALLMVGFWLMMGMANGARTFARRGKASGSAGDTGKDFPRWTQPLLLLLAVVIAEVALLPQSRGAFWAFFIVIPFFLILSPHRFRALADVALVILPVALFWGDLNAPYQAITAATSLQSALTTHLIAVGYSAAIVLGGWAVTWGIERWIGPLRKRAVTWIGVGIACLAILGAAGGVIYADIRADNGIDDYVAGQWDRFWSDENTISSGQSRLETMGLSSRLTQWKVAYQAAQENPALGLGAQNFEDYWYQNRPEVFPITQPHSLPLRLLAELGVPGLVLWLAFAIGALVYAVMVRFRSSDRTMQVLVAATTVAALSWMVHSSVEWLWQLAGVTLPVMMLLGGLIGATKDGSALPVTERPRRSWRSVLVRGLLALFALGAIASAAFPYTSSRYSALAAGASDLEQAQARADTAAWLDPTSTEPYVSLAGVHQTAAASASTAADRLEQLRLEAAQWERVSELEPNNWGPHYQAAEALLAARDAARDARIFSVTQELTAQARIHLEEARRLNPLSPEVDELEKAL